MTFIEYGENNQQVRDQLASMIKHHKKQLKYFEEIRDEAHKKFLEYSCNAESTAIVLGHMESDLEQLKATEDY